MLLPIIFAAALAAAAPPPDPRKLLADDRLLAAPLELKQAPGRHSAVFRGEKGTSGFNLHSYIAHYDGRFWAAWSSAMVHEEDPDQHIRYATSQDGHTWSPSAVLAPDPDGPNGPKRWITRGLFVEAGKLHALGALVESAAYGNRGKGVVWEKLALMRFTWSGKDWTPAGLYAGDCMNNFPAVRIAGMLSMPCRDRNMSVSYRMSDRPAAGWKIVPISNDPPFHRMDEPTVYEAADGTVHLIVRDGTRSGRLIRIVSRDKGKSWDLPVSTNYPDATSKNFAARLSSGAYYLINNPNTAGRDPLAISFSRDGWVYDGPLALRKNGPPPRFSTRKSALGSLQYPHAMEHNGSLWVIYSTNKEDIEISELRLQELGL
jgi:hypothetical protein